MQNLKHLQLLLFLFIFNLPNITAQYYPLYAKERNTQDIEGLSKALDLFNQKDYDKAISMLDSLGDYFKKEKDYQSFLTAKNEAANLCLLTRDYIRGYKILESSMPEYATHRDTNNLEYALSLRFLGIITEKGGLENDKKINLLLRQLSIHESIGRPTPAHAACLADIGLYYNYKHKMDKAIPYLLAAKEMGDLFGNIATSTVIDLTLIDKLGENNPAIQIKNKNLLYESVYPYRNTYAIAVYSMYIAHMLGIDYYKTGDYAHALQYQKEAENILDSLNYPATKPPVFFPLEVAKCYASLGSYDLARQKILKSQKRFRTIKKGTIQESEFYQMVADVYRYFNTDSAIHYISKAIQDTSNLDLLVSAYILSGEIYSSEGMYKNAKEQTDKALRLIHKNKGNIAAPMVSHEYDYPTQQALFFLSGEICHNLAQQNASKELLIKSLDYYLCADTCIWQLVTNKTEMLISEARLASYDKLTTLSLKAARDLYTKEPEKAFPIAAHFILNSKSLSLRSELYKMEYASFYDEHDSLFSAKLKRERQIRDIQNQIQALKKKDLSIDSLQYAMKNLEIENLIAAYQAMQIMKTTHEVHGGFVSVSDIQKELFPNEIFTEYVLDTNNLYTLIITKETSKIEITENDGIDHLIKKHLYNTKTGQISNNTAQSLGEKLLSFLIDEMKDKDRLILIGDKSMLSIPFENLHIGKSLLINQKTVVYNYAASLWLKGRTEKSSRRPANILLVAPVFDMDAPAYSDLNVYRDIDSTAQQEIFRSGGYLKPLLYSLEEAVKVNDLYGQNKLISNLLLRQDATEKRFKELASGYDIIHISSHGYSSSDNFEESGLFFYQETDTSDDRLTNEGFLYLGEVYNLDLQADLIVLSACKTGSGEIIKGEGVMALPRGFMVAGVPNIIGSLWKIHDEKTKNLMVLFYEYLLTGADYARALQQAKQVLIENGEIPLDWSGIILIGD